MRLSDIIFVPICMVHPTCCKIWRKNRRAVLSVTYIYVCLGLLGLKRVTVKFRIKVLFYLIQNLLITGMVVKTCIKTGSRVESSNKIKSKKVKKVRRTFHENRNILLMEQKSLRLDIFIIMPPDVRNGQTERVNRVEHFIEGFNNFPHFMAPPPAQLQGLILDQLIQVHGVCHDVVLNVYPGGGFPAAFLNNFLLIHK